ncbi:MAG: hypothetical protein WC942_06120 [Clostridia bacterium]|jgi:hypothetical protein
MGRNHSHNYGSHIPELKPWLKKYGAKFSHSPQYVLIGSYNTSSNTVMGILGAANNEFYAYILRREILKNGYCEIKRTEYHENPNFSIEEYMIQVIEASELQGKDFIK